MIFAVLLLLLGGCPEDDGDDDASDDDTDGDDDSSVADDDAADDDSGDDDTAPTERLQPEDFTYEGAFRLPSDFDWGARGLGYRPDGDGGAGSLLVTGFEADPAWFGEVEIPAPVVVADWLTLPQATLLSPMAEFDGDLVETTLDGHTTAPSGIEWVAARGSQASDKLYGSVDWWYAVSGDTFPTVWMSELDGSNPRGLFHVGPPTLPHHGNKAGDFLFTVPTWYAGEVLGGRTLITGKTRGAFGGSMGPTLFAFHPWDNDDPGGDLDAIEVLWYRELHPDCAGPNAGDPALCDYPDFTMCDKWLGASFIEAGAKRAIVLLGVKGLGDNGYGPADPGDCSPYQGYHCDPFERQLVFYDIDQLAQVVEGLVDPWTVVPYTIWRPPELFLDDGDGTTCGDTGGMAFDAAGGRVFMVERGLGENSAVVHVWTVQEDR